MTKVLAISGSLRKGSLNSGLVRAAAEHAPDGVEVTIYEGLDKLPHYNQDIDTDVAPAPVAELRKAIKEADALFISTPEFNASIPGALKNAIDWASRPRGEDASLFAKPVSVAGVSPSDYGALWAQDHLRKALGIAGARVDDADLTLGGAFNHFDKQGNLTDDIVAGRLQEHLASLSKHHRALAA